MEDVSFLL